MTPLLIFIGIPAPVAVASEANQIVASSVSGVNALWRRGNVDFKMGGVLLAGGFVGSYLGVELFAWLRTIGQIDPVIRLSFVFFLGIIGTLMLVESSRAILRQPAEHSGHDRSGQPHRRRSGGAVAGRDIASGQVRRGGGRLPSRHTASAIPEKSLSA